MSGNSRVWNNIGHLRWGDTWQSWSGVLAISGTKHRFIILPHRWKRLGQFLTDSTAKVSGEQEPTQIAFKLIRLSAPCSSFMVTCSYLSELLFAILPPAYPWSSWINCCPRYPSSPWTYNMTSMYIKTWKCGNPKACMCLEEVVTMTKDPVLIFAGD